MGERAPLHVAADSIIDQVLVTFQTRADSLTFHQVVEATKRACPGLLEADRGEFYRQLFDDLEAMDTLDLVTVKRRDQSQYVREVTVTDKGWECARCLRGQDPSRPGDEGTDEQALRQAEDPEHRRGTTPLLDPVISCPSAPTLRPNSRLVQGVTWCSLAPPLHPLLRPRFRKSFVHWLVHPWGDGVLTPNASDF